MKRLGSLSLGQLTALCTLCGVGFVLYVKGQEMFSPAPLSERSRGTAAVGGVRSHAEIASNCAACHVSPWGGETMATRCLDCHTEIRTEISAGQKMHGQVSDGTDCRSCHTEHKGPHGAITSFAGFDHDRTDYKLTGKHDAVDCASCHVKQTYKGTATSCVSCHAEPISHQQRFGANCVQCHTTSTWDTGFKKNGATLALTSLAGFNHDSTGFKLTGKHKTTACMSCHANQVLTGMISHACATCHNEPPSHKGRFGANCTQCHSTNTWDTSGFTHRFPINHRVGGNKTNACAKCHSDNNNFVSYTCSNCHTHSPERVARQHPRLKLAQLNQCAKCHPTGRSGGSRKAAVHGDSIDVCLACPDTLGLRTSSFLHGGGAKTVPLIPPSRLTPLPEQFMNFLRFPMISKLPGSRL